MARSLLYVQGEEVDFIEAETITSGSRDIGKHRMVGRQWVANECYWMAVISDVQGTIIMVDNN